MCVCMCVYIYACMHACMHACIMSMYVSIYVCACVCMYVSMYACLVVCVHGFGHHCNPPQVHYYFKKNSMWWHECPFPGLNLFLNKKLGIPRRITGAFFFNIINIILITDRLLIVLGGIWPK